MTDKQAIIDGVDVSGCKKLMQGIVPFGCMEDRKTCNCMNNPNCLYKQLKRKERECEELKKANDGILTTIRILAKNNIRLREILSEIKEIAEANIRIADLEGLNGVYRRGLAKQILQKISEI